jgi:hypothetical protein
VLIPGEELACHALALLFGEFYLGEPESGEKDSGQQAEHGTPFVLGRARYMKCVVLLVELRRQRQYVNGCIAPVGV